MERETHNTERSTPFCISWSRSHGHTRGGKSGSFRFVFVGEAANGMSKSKVIVGRETKGYCTKGDFILSDCNITILYISIISSWLLLFFALLSFPLAVWRTDRNV